MTGKIHDGKARTEVVPFIDENEKLCTLLEHPVVEGVAESLLGPDFNYLAGDGNYYSGDTAWHSDGWWDPVCKFIKVAFYLDPLTYSTGALRVIPGSHVISDQFGEAAQKVCNAQSAFGMHGRDIPAVALETEPGDLAIFNHNCKHASFGGSKRRRMFTLNLGEHARTPEQLERLRKYLSMHIPRWSPRTHSELMRSTANPRRMRHLSQVIENEAHVIELHQKTLQPA
jgi:ectoine hydroxylase-related dioxygenase (phytanoyl-CoA dioxygenase family)